MDGFRSPLPKVRPGRPLARGRLALVLQGGGALGAYQAGVYQALHEAGLEPEVAGVSIGGVNAAIIAGNPPDRRVERLREFWERVTAPADVALYTGRRRTRARPATLVIA